MNNKNKGNPDLQKSLGARSSFQFSAYSATEGQSKHQESGVATVRDRRDSVYNLICKNIEGFFGGVHGGGGTFVEACHLSAQKGGSGKTKWQVGAGFSAGGDKHTVPTKDRSKHDLKVNFKEQGPRQTNDQKTTQFLEGSRKNFQRK